MAKSILLVTPAQGFGELICQTLREDGGYDVLIAATSQAAIETAEQTSIDLTIIDCDLEDMTIGDLAAALTDLHTKIRIIVVPPDNDPTHPELTSFKPHAFLPKPFYLPDLPKIVAKVIKGQQVDLSKFSIYGEDDQIQSILTDTSETDLNEPPGTAGSAIPPPVPAQASPLQSVSQSPNGTPPPTDWLQDVNLAAQHLTRLSLESAAKASLITKDSQLWAYAGEFDQPTANTLAETVHHYWQRYGGVDLARFIQLDPNAATRNKKDTKGNKGDKSDNEKDFMLYATKLTDALVLAMVFDARMPFSQIRSQATSLAQSLTTTSSAPQPTPAAATIIAESPPQHELSTVSPPAGEQPEIKFEAIPTDWLPTRIREEEAILNEISQDIDSEPMPTDWQPDLPVSKGRRTFLEELLSDPLPASPLPYQAASAQPDLEATQPSASHSDETQLMRNQPIFPPPESMSETRPNKLADIDPNQPTASMMEPDSPSLYNLIYTCVVIPRIPEHLLVGTLADRLSDWVPQICIAFGWRLEQLSVRPEHLQTIIKVPPATSPGYLLRIICQITSQRIFHEFPYMEAENPSKEFWAPGHLLVSRNRILSAEVIRDFIDRTRGRQGF